MAGSRLGGTAQVSVRLTPRRGRGPRTRPGPRPGPLPEGEPWVSVRGVEGFGLHRTERDGCAVLAVRGEVDLATAPRLREELTTMVSDGYLRLVVDLTDTEFLDSTGLGALVTGLKRVRARGGEMRVVCTSDRVCKVFEITSLDRVLPLYATVDEACAGA